MKIQLSKFCLLILVINIYACKSTTKKLKIVPISFFNFEGKHKSNGDTLFWKNEFYLVCNYYEDKINDSIIENYAKKFSDTSSKVYSEVVLTFYKESKQTNMKNLLKNKKILEKYSDEYDKIFVFNWVNSRNLYKYKYQNGQIINSKNNINIKDIE